MQVAFIAKTKAQVEIIEVKHGWTTVRDIGSTKEYKVRNSQIGGRTMVDEKIVREYKANGTGPVAKVKAEKAAKVAKEPRAKMDISERKNGAVDPLYLPQYVTYSTVRADGSKLRSIDKGDSVALQLRQLLLPAVYTAVAKATGTSVVELKERFNHLNPGMQRMNLGNMLRRATR